MEGQRAILRCLLYSCMFSSRLVNQFCLHVCAWQIVVKVFFASSRQLMHVKELQAPLPFTPPTDFTFIYAS